MARSRGHDKHWSNSRSIHDAHCPPAHCWTQALQGQPSQMIGDALSLATRNRHAHAGEQSRPQLRDRGFGNLVTYSRKVFIPLTHLCRDVCHYCTFAQTPKHIGAPLHVDRAGARGGAAGQSARLQGSAVHTRRKAGAALQGRARSARTDGLRDARSNICTRRPRPCSTKPGCCRTPIPAR